MERNQLKRMCMHKIDHEPTLTTIETVFNCINSKTLITHALHVFERVETLNQHLFFELLNKKATEINFFSKISKTEFSKFLSKNIIQNSAFTAVLNFYKLIGVEEGDYKIHINNFYIYFVCCENPKFEIVNVDFSDGLQKNLFLEIFYKNFLNKSKNFETNIQSKSIYNDKRVNNGKQANNEKHVNSEKQVNIENKNNIENKIRNKNDIENKTNIENKNNIENKIKNKNNIENKINEKGQNKNENNINKEDEIEEWILKNEFSEKNILLNILGHKNLVDFRTVSNEYKKFLNPLQCYGTEHSYFLPQFMCFLKSENKICTICNHSVKNSYEYFSTKKDFFEQLISKIDYHSDPELHEHGIQHGFCNNTKILKFILNSIVSLKDNHVYKNEIETQQNFTSQSREKILNLYDKNRRTQSLGASQNHNNSISGIQNLPDMSVNSTQKTTQSNNISGIENFSQIDNTNHNSLTSQKKKHSTQIVKKVNTVTQNPHTFTKFHLLKHFDTLNPKNEQIFLDTLKILLKQEKPNLLSTVIKIFNNANLTPKITFGIFSIFYTIFQKTENSFLLLKIQNEIFKNEKIFKNVKEYCFECFKDTRTLSRMFNKDENSFIDENVKHMMCYDGFKLSDEQILMNIPYYIAKTKRLESTILGYNTTEIVNEYAPYIISAMLCTRNYDFEFIEPFLDTKQFIKNNISAIFFNIKVQHEKGECENVFDTFKFLLYSIKIPLKTLMPFFEFFVEKSCDTEIYCDDIFDLVGENEAHLLFPYLSNKKLTNSIISNNQFEKLIKLGDALLYGDSKQANKEGAKKFGNFLKNYISTGNVVSSGKIDSVKSTKEYFKIIRNREFSYLIYVYVDLCFFVGHYDYELLGLIGDTWQRQAKKFYEEHEKDTLSNVCDFLVNNVLCHFNAVNQDLYFFAIQETLKHVDTGQESCESLKKFRTTRYFVPIKHDFVPNHEKNLKFEDFVKYCLNALVSVFYSFDTMVADILKIGTILELSAIQDYVFCGAELLPKDKKELFVSLINTDQNKQSITFLLQLQLSSEIFDVECCVKLAAKIQNYYFLVYFLEKSGKNLEELLRAYYLVGDYVSVRAVIAILPFVDSNTLFYGFLADRNFEMARECLRVHKKVINYEDLGSNFDKYNKTNVEEIVKAPELTVEQKMCALRVADDLKIEDETVIKLRILNTKRVNFEAYEDAIESENCKPTIKKLKPFLMQLKLKQLRKSQEYNKAISEMTKLVIEREWYALYEHAKVLQCLNRKVEAKITIKKMIGLVDEKEKALVLQAVLHNNKKFYEETISKVKKNEKLFFYYAKALEENDEAKAVEAYSRSIIYGSKYHNRSIPLLFHLLCEKKHKINFYKLIKPVLFELFKNTTYFVPFINQILPKITHSENEIFEIICSLLILMFNKHNSLFWNSMIFINGIGDTAKRILKVIEVLSFDAKMVLQDTKAMCRFFTDVCGLKTAKGVKELFPKIGKVVVPISRAEIEIENDEGLNVIYNNYICNDVYIEGIDDDVVIFHTLQSPKRIGLVCSDGKTYLFLCKPNDDLRKDSRFMDLILLLNSVFKENKIKSYNVVPITHKHGLIEWISDLKSYKSILYKYYAKIDINPELTLRKYRTKKKIGVAEFKNVLSQHPPVFQDWFKSGILNPIDWFLKRKTYTSTYSVMCCVGWFLGLGDRHGENIMFSSSGETVHVDLNCLFENAKKFEIPEVVPFRLTQNIQSAFGLLKTDGVFTNVFCETLKTFQINKELIFSNLLSFVYDPLWEWNRKISAQQVLNNLEKKIGCDDVGVKCDELVEVAGNENNLANMYIGWSSFL